MTAAAVSITSVFPDAVRVRADEIRVTDSVFTATGDRVTLSDVRTLPGGRTRHPRVRTTRADGVRDYWAPDELVTVSRPPAVGAWCPITRGFWTGGTYARVRDLRVGDRFRWLTYTDHAVTRHPYVTTYLGDDVCDVHVSGRDTPMRFGPDTLLELQTRT